MLTWLIALPALITGFAVSLMLLRRRGRLAVRLFWTVNAVVLLAGVVVLVQALTAGRAVADTADAAGAAPGVTGPRCWARRLRWQAPRSAPRSRSPIPARRRWRPCLTTGIVRPCHGDRRARRRHRHLWSCRRGDPDPAGMTGPDMGDVVVVGEPALVTVMRWRERSCRLQRARPRCVRHGKICRLTSLWWS